MLPTRNELLTGFVISVLLSLLANFALMMQRYQLIIHSPAGHDTFKMENLELWISLSWFFIFSFVLFILYRCIYKWGNRIFRDKYVKTLGLATGCCLLVAFGLFKAYPALHRITLTQLYGVGHVQIAPERMVSLTSISSKTAHTFERTETGSAIGPDTVRNGIISIIPNMNYRLPLLIEHIFVCLTILLTMLLIHLIDKKQEMKLAYEKVKVEQLENTYNALMGQINPHFFFNSLNGLNSLIRTGNQERTIEYLERLSEVFRYILQSNHKTLVSLNEELQFIRSYTYLLGIRYENKLFFSFKINDDSLQKYLPVLSLLPLIENVVKHNVITKKHPIEIQIYAVNGNQLIITNTIRTKQEKCISTGIGLTNLQRRYRMLTDKNIRISDAGGSFEVSLPLLEFPVKQVI